MLLFSILLLDHPRLRSFSVASCCFESRWVHSVLVYFTLFYSASCRVDFNYAVLWYSLYLFSIFHVLNCPLYVLMSILSFRSPCSCFPFLLMDDPRLRSFSVASCCFESRWVHVFIPRRAVLVSTKLFDDILFICVPVFILSIVNLMC